MKCAYTVLAFCLTMLCVEGYGQINLNQGLLAYYPFSGNANDASGNNNHGSPQNGIQLTTDKFGNANSAYRFDGIDDHIIVFDNGKLSPKKISVVAWVYAESSSPQSITGKIQKTTGYHATYHIGINYDIQAGFFWGLAPGSSSCFQQIPYNPNNPFVTSPDYFSANSWHCVVGTFEDSVQKLYVDGVLVKSRKNNFKDLDQCSNTNFLIGRWWDGDPIPFKGKIDEVRVYDRALNQQEINALCDVQFTCGNWLSVPSRPSFVNIGDLDIPGDKITVEAMINATAVNSGGIPFEGDIVSKHTFPGDVNYLLRPSRAEITTSNGFFATPDICPVQLNKTYHVAMVYDGSSLKFYRNGFLMSQVPATGNLFQNNWHTLIGYYARQIDNTQMVGYINEVRIWNVARTQAQIQTHMNTSLPSPTTQTGLLAYYIFNNLLNKQGNAAWTGNLGGAATIGASNPSCAAFSQDSCTAAPIVSDFDFNYKQDVCNPFSVQFFGTGSNLQNPYWSFDNGNTNTSSLNPIYTFSSFGTYTIKFSAQQGTARDTITKVISVDVIKDNIILTSDTTICAGATKQLRSVPSLNFCWTPTTYLNDPNLPDPITSTPQNITYYLTAEVTGNNLIVNGDFSAGNTGFTSGYNYITQNTLEGEYYIGNNPQPWNGGMSNCRDHTTGNGLMMMVNGAPIANTKVWTQTITVTPNTNYAFSTWIQALHSSNPAQLQFSINGRDIGGLITASLPPCSWSQFFTTWNSGNNTTATISIVNKNTILAGNDFALDDISFAPVFVKRDSVNIAVEKPNVKTINDTAFCPGTSIQLNASGAVAYSWSPATGLNSTTIANPLAIPAATTQYIVTGTSANGCTAKDTVVLSMHTKPTITKTNDTAICRNTSVQLFVSGGTSYLWSPAGSISNPYISNPVASPITNEIYRVQITAANTCTYNDSVKVDIRPRPLFTIISDKRICEGKTVTLGAGGGSEYLWSPAALVDNPVSPNPVASPRTNTLFTVHVTEGICRYDSILTVNVSVDPMPDVSVQKSNDLDCVTNNANLIALGAERYTWSPSFGLDNPNSGNPVCNATVTTLYTVTGTNTFGCSASDTITVKVTNAGRPIFELPNAFTPNGDRVNDCFGIRKWARVNQLEFVIYNRWGQKVFSTSDPSQCWDGTINGTPQDSGGFVYTIKAKSTCGEVFRKGIIMLIR